MSCILTHSARLHYSFCASLACAPRRAPAPSLAHRNIEQAHTLAFGTGLILEKTEEERAFSGSRGCFVPVQIPQQRLAGGAGSRILLGAPNRPERRGEIGRAHV